MVRKASGEYSKNKEYQLSQAAKAAFDWFSTCYGAFTPNQYTKFQLSHLQKENHQSICLLSIDCIHID